MGVTTVLILIVIGLFAGVFGGMFGVGGAVIMIPALVYFLSMEQHIAQGTSVAVMLPPIGLLAAYNYYKAGAVNLWYAVIIAVAFMIGGYFGSKVALAFPGHIMRKIFGVILLLIALKMILSKQTGTVN